MTRLEVTSDFTFAGFPKGTILYDAVWGIRDWDHVPAWSVPIGDDGFVYFAPSEVILLPDVKHRSYYEEYHPGEQEPDSWDRGGYKTGHGRHLLDDGVS